MSKNKTAIAIAILLMASIAVTLPLGVAEDRYYTSYIYVATGTGNRPTALGDSVLLVAWTADMPPDTGEKVGIVSSPTGRAGWAGMQIKVWDPDNSRDSGYALQ